MKCETKDTKYFEFDNDTGKLWIIDNSGISKAISKYAKSPN